MITNPIISKYSPCRAQPGKPHLTRVALCGMAAAGLLLTACNTSRGFGQDVQRVGHEIEEKVR